MNISNPSNIFVYGEDLQSVLLKVAFCSAETGAHVWFITPEPFNTIPTCIPIYERDVLKLVTFVYLTDVFELLKHLNEVHTWMQIPKLIIVDKLNYYMMDIHSGAFIFCNLLDVVNTYKMQSRGILLIASYYANIKRNSILEKVIALYFDYCIQIDQLWSLLPNDFITN